MAGQRRKESVWYELSDSIFKGGAAVSLLGSAAMASSAWDPLHHRLDPKLDGAMDRLGEFGSELALWGVVAMTVGAFLLLAAGPRSR